MGLDLTNAGEAVSRMDATAAKSAPTSWRLVGPKRSRRRVAVLSSRLKKCLHLAMRAKHRHRNIPPMLVDLFHKKRRVPLLEFQM